jgi:hypothetical protein
VNVSNHPATYSLRYRRCNAFHLCSLPLRYFIHTHFSGSAHIYSLTHNLPTHPLFCLRRLNDVSIIYQHNGGSNLIRQPSFLHSFHSVCDALHLMTSPLVSQFLQMKSFRTFFSSPFSSHCVPLFLPSLVLPAFLPLFSSSQIIDQSLPMQARTQDPAMITPTDRRLLLRSGLQLSDGCKCVDSYVHPMSHLYVYLRVLYVLNLARSRLKDPLRRLERLE